MKLVINADDLGVHPAVGRAVSILVEKGIVTSASVVATGMDVENACAMEGIDIGIHLDILRGRPLTHWQHINSIVDENGVFLKDPVALFRLYAMGKVVHEDVEQEWSAQIERVLDLGVKPTHLSSHKHVHAWPSLSVMVADLAKRYGIDWVRKPEDCTEIAQLDKTPFSAKFDTVCGMFTRETTDVNWTDVFWPANDERDHFSPGQFAAHIRSSKKDGEDRVVEIRCCPGVTAAGDPPIPSECSPTKIGPVWESTFSSLAEDDWASVIDELGMELTTFSELG